MGLEHASTPPLRVMWDYTSREQFFFVLEWITARDLPIKLADVKRDGQITVSLNRAMSAAERGTFLLDLERDLKEEFDPAITLWLASSGDKNPLRNLRGIEIKHE